MARFRFSLEPLLKLRRLEEDQKKSAYLLALRSFKRKEAEIAEISRRREEEKARCREEESGRIDLESLLVRRRFLNVLYQRIAEKRSELRVLRPALDEARASYRRAARRRRAVEKIRERRLNEFLREEDRREQRALDEVGQVAFLRSRADRSGSLADRGDPRADPDAPAPGASGEP